MYKLIILLSLISSSVFAVKTSKCSSTLEINMPEVQVFSSSFIQAQIKDYYRRVDYTSIENFLEGNIGELVFKAELTSKQNSVCVYSSSDHFNQFHYVRIAGTVKDAYLVMEFEDSQTSLSIFASPTSKSHLYDFAGSVAQIKAEAWGESWGDSYLVNIPLGKAIIK